MTTLVGAGPQGPALPFEPPKPPAATPPAADIDELIGATVHLDPDAPKAPATPFVKKSDPEKK
jgi:hypothetical protein